MGNFIYVARGYLFENVCVIYIEHNISRLWTETLGTFGVALQLPPSTQGDNIVFY